MSSIRENPPKEMAGFKALGIRPSGTEPKIKPYVASRADTQAAADELNDKMAVKAQEWMK
ncbi:MAG: hypothetical protein IKN04_03735 [Clostridia bacterium]|nr:hypothetical protein [Clostridia bacterium]